MRSLREPIFSLATTIVLFCLSFTGAIFLWILSLLYSNPDSWQFGHALSDEIQSRASRNLLISSIFYAILTVASIFQLVLHLRKFRRQAWDPAIAMVDVRTPKGAGNFDPKRSNSTTPLNEKTSPAIAVHFSPDAQAFKRRSVDHGSQ